MKLAFFMLLLIPGLASAQAGRVDSVQNQSAAIHRPLPPSILLELRRSQRGRTLIYRDTVKAADLEHAHANDTTEGAFSDSAISLIDTAVSLSHKEWLDSELVEVPELARVGNRVHFNYPPAIMTESEMTPVPFDSTILDRMNPVTREVLPFFDQSPIPMPLPIPRPMEAFLELGGGNINQPNGRGFFQEALTDRTSLSLSGDLESRPSLPMNFYLNLASIFHASLGSDPALFPLHSSELDASLGMTDRWLTLRSDSLHGNTVDHSIAVENLGVDFHGDASELLHYSIQLEDHQWDEDTVSETSQFVGLNIASGMTSGYQTQAQIEYLHSSLNLGDRGEAGRFALLFGNRPGEMFAWDAGVASLSGIGVGQSLLPVAHIRYALNPRWEFGASFDPRVQLSTMATLTTIDPFLTSLTGRGAVMDKLNVRAFTNYILSADDAIHLEARIVTRDHDPIFESITLPDSAVAARAQPASTRRIEFTAGGNFLLFERDILTASLTLASTTNLDSGTTLPFEPTMKFEASYRFNSISDMIRSSIHFRTITLPDRTLGMIDIEVKAQLSEAVQAKLSFDNILNGASDFWPGYPEAPRSISLSARYAF